MKYHVAELFPTPLIMTTVEENTDELKSSNQFTTSQSDDSKYDYVQYKDGKRILENYPEIRDILLNKFTLFANNLMQYKDKKYIITTSWLTHTKKGDRSTLHKHQNTFWSGVYYFQDEYPKGTAELSFSNPNEQLTSICFTNDDIKNFNKLNSNSFVIEPEPKMLLLFPSYLYHQVVLHKLDTKRLSLAFNIMPITEWGSGDSYFDMSWVQ